MHGSETNMLSKLRKYVDSHQPIPIETMVEAFNTASSTRRDIEYRRAASDIISEAGVYLHPVELSWFVSARGSDGKARELIRHRRAYIMRAAALLPALLSLLIVKNNNDLESILRRIDDFCRDFPVIRAAHHEKKVRKEIRSGLRRVSRTVAELAELLDEFGRHIDIEFNHHNAAVTRAEESERFADSFEPFRKNLQRLVLAAEIVHYRESVDGTGLIVTDNKIRTYTVECMYQLSIWQHGRPAFVTTPGSDFAAGCSLLYEIASGERDVSLAGAINKFARSATRTEIFEEEQSFRWEDSGEGMRDREAENFADVQEQTSRLRSEVTFWDDILQSREWNAFSRRELNERRADVLERLERTLRENGPHLVWGDQVRHAYGSSHSDGPEEAEDRLLKAEIALGQARRQSGDT